MTYYCEVCDKTIEEEQCRPIFVNIVNIKFNNSVQNNGVCCKCWRKIDEEEKEEFEEYMDTGKIHSYKIINKIPVPYFTETFE